jgi:hypothetical protein
MPSAPKRPLYRGSTLKNLEDIWKVGEIKPNPYGFAGGISGGLHTPRSLATRGVMSEKPLDQKIGVVVYFKPELRKKLTPIKYKEETFKKNLKLAQYVRDSLGLGISEELGHTGDIVQGAISYRREKEFVSEKPIPFKENVQKVQIFVTPDNLAEFARSLIFKNDKSQGFFTSALISGYSSDLPSPQSPHRHKMAEKRRAFLITALTSKIARQLKGVPLEIYYGRPDYEGRMKPALTTSGEVPKIRRKDFSLFLPKMKRARWGVFNSKEGFPTAYSQALTKPEAEKTAKRYEKELGKPLEVRKLRKDDWRKPIYL